MRTNVNDGEIVLPAAAPPAAAPTPAASAASASVATGASAASAAACATEKKDPSRRNGEQAAKTGMPIGGDEHDVLRDILLLPLLVHYLRRLLLGSLLVSTFCRD